MSKDNSSEAPLPSIWTTATLGELGSWYGGGTPSKANPSFWKGLIPWVSPKDMKTNVITQSEDHISQEAIENSSTRLVPEGAVLLVTRSGILEHTLPVALAGIPVALNQDLKALVPHAGIESHYTAFALRSHAGRILQSCSKAGTTVASIDFERLKEFELPLPPTNEQRRIVSKLESLLARSRRAKEALGAIPALLERFRQSVLAAAFRGDLTADWREQHPGVEPASKLLDRIRAERRRRWEEAELEKMRTKGKVPKNETWKTAYEEQVSPDPSELSELPNNWCWASLGELTEFVTSGSRGWADFYSDTGPVFLRVGNLDRHTIDLDLRELSHVLPPEGAEGIRTKAANGDILISITADVGMVGIVPEGLGDAYVNQHIALCRPLPMLNVRALAYALTDPKGLQKIVREIQYGATKASLSLIQVRNLPVPMPPLAEQAALASRLDRALAVVKRLEQQITELSARQQALDAAVLVKAFRGELVPQDPNDEPASVLLERIRAEREASDGSTPKRSRGRRPAA